MNKIIAINLCGIVFQIDEMAYESLKKYLAEIKNNLGISTAANEIYQDVENRIAELFQHKINSGAQAILPTDINEVIAMMGNPEQFKEFDEENKQQNSNAKTTSFDITHPFRKIYRNADDKVLGGVCSGLAAYLGIDPIIMRLVFVALFFIGGFTFVIYLICWIAIPKAATAAEKMAMQGKPFTFGDVKKNVKTEMNDVKNNFERMRSEYVQNRSYSSFTEIIRTIFKVIAFAFLIVGLMILIPIAIALIAVFITAGFAVPMLASTFIATSGQAVMIMLCVFAVVFIPIAGIIYKLLRTIFKSRPMHTWLRTTLTVAWFGAIVFLFFQTISISKDFHVQKSVKDIVVVNPIKEKSVLVDAEDFHSSNNSRSAGLQFNHLRMTFNPTLDSVLNSYVDLDIKPSIDSAVHIEISKIANGKDENVAKDFAEDIHYALIQKDSTIVLPRYFYKSKQKLWRNQHVELKLFLPENKIIHFTQNALDMMTDENFQTPYQDWDDEKIIRNAWVMTSNGLRLAK